MRNWLLTNTTYGIWLPGDPRGSVTSVRDVREGETPRAVRFEHDLPGAPWEDAIPGLYRSAKDAMKGPPVFLNYEMADAVLEQFHETAFHRDWMLRAVAIMHNHFHIVVQVNRDPSPRKILADFKAYASRKLNELYGTPKSDTWWTTNGSKRKLKGDTALNNGIQYVVYKQPNPLVTWWLEMSLADEFAQRQKRASRKRQRPEL